MDAGGSHSLRADLLQELGDDGLAPGLARSLTGSRAGHREPDPVSRLRARRSSFSGAAWPRWTKARHSSPHQIDRARKGREIVNRLTETGLVDLPPPSGAFYAFLKVKGAANSQEIATRLIDEANVGLAPGTAFGEEWRGLSARSAMRAIRRSSKRPSRASAPPYRDSSLTFPDRRKPGHDARPIPSAIDASGNLRA